MNLKVKINKLQQALLTKGKLVKIHQFQQYSTKLERIITVYSICMPEWDIKKGKVIDKQKLSTSSPVEVVMFLAEEYKKVGG